MKNKIKRFGLIALAAITLFACASGSDGKHEPDLSGVITIMDAHNEIAARVEINTPLSAVYSGEAENIFYQWNRYGTALSGATGTEYTPVSAGRYTVTVGADGYRSKTSLPVTVFDPSVGGPSAAELVADIKIGWNLGNTLDCYDLGWLGSNPSASAMETAWGNPVTTKANIDALKNAGFNAIRIPVSWAKAANSNYVIRADWINRVKQVVDYAVANDMYIVLNTHHDEEIFKFRNNDREKSTKAFGKIWEQIAEAFKDYNEKLIFEGLNEPRTKGSSTEWNGGTAEERDNLNIHYQIFVDTVRASGGNNEKRFLVLNTYGASGVAAAINGLKIPDDTAEDKIIASYHSYAPYNFALNTNSAFNTWNRNNSADTQPITEMVDRAYDTFVSKGIPVIVGEFGAMNKNNEAVRAEWAEFYVGYARSKGIPCFWWDNGVTDGSGELFGLLNRKTNQFTYPTIITALMRGSAHK